MNRVYKVIWSKAKHCYVVTSEIARSVTKSASSARSAGRKGTAVLAMAALLFTAGGVLGEAAYVTDVKQGSTTDVIMVTKDDGKAPDTITINNVEKAKEAIHATAADRATRDGNGVIIDTNYVKNAAAEVEAGGTYVKTDKTVGQNLSALDKQVKANADAVADEVSNRKAADQGNLKIGAEDEILKVKEGGTEAVKKLVLNVDGDNPITMDDNGIKVGKNSTVIASDGVFAGGDTADAAKAALNADGSIKGAAGKFTVATDGKVTAKGGVDTDGREILTRNGNINAGSGDISGKDISASGSLHADGDISGKDISGKDITGSGTVRGRVVTDGIASMEGGKVQGTSVSDGIATLSGGSLTGAVDIKASGTITGHDVVVNGKLTTNGLETDHITLGSEPLNYTKIDKGNVTSKILATDGGVIPIAESIFNKDGSSITVRTNEGSVDSTGNSTVGGKEIIQYLGNNAVPDVKNVTRRMVRYDDGTFSMVDTAVDGKDKYSIVSQNAGERKVTVVEGTKNLNVTENLTNGIVSETNGGAGKTVTLTQGMDGTYKVETDGTSTEKIGGQKIENYKGGLDTNITGNETHDVSGDMTTTVTGDSSLSATDIENKASSSIWNHVGEGYNTSWKMTDGKISESIVNGTASNKENTTAEGTKRIITSEEGTGTYNQTATSNNISLKNKAGDTSFTKSESLLKGEKTSVTNPNGSSTINQSAESIVNFVKNTKGHATKTEQSAEDITNTAKNGTITNDAKIVKTITGKNKVISDNGGTTFENEAHSTAVKDGTVKKTTISGNTIETGQATMDYADVTKDLSVGHNATVENDLTVKGTSEFVGRADFRYDVYVDNNLTVAKKTRTDTLYVDHDGYVGGNLNVDGNIETHDAVLSADSRQVVTGRQLYQTNERVDRLDNRIKKVGANAAALAALRPGDFNPDDKFSIAAGFGSYRNANAAALGLFYRPNENVLLSLGTSFGDGENMVNAGVSVKFGRGKSMAERRKEMADEVSSMRDEMRSQDERIAELEEMLKKQSELIEKLSKES